MRKFLKNNILELFQTMYEAHREIKKFIDKSDIDSAGIILGDLQNTAVQIGTAIEQSEGEGFVTVGYLEEYCEELYNVSQNISAGNGSKAQKTLDKKLIKSENSVKNDIRIKSEVVFISYKASMWDSFESVWEKMRNDPLYDVYVIAVPYYDRNPDGSFGQFHYEGNEYPEYVPVVHYEIYDLAARKPDIIFFHNPYDECNYVTSVHPMYYSSELKKHTDMLVYIPYFVLQEISPDDTAGVKSIEHFVITPGVINADKVIVQSENMRQIYINVLLDRIGNTSANRSMLEKKIDGSGSPKIERLKKLKLENLSLPESWKKIIYKSSGERKKIIFYNNSVSALLDNNENMIRKLKETIKIFSGYKDDVTLLWRPHPLMMATIASMRPDLYSQYSDIVEQYKKEGWGIYDESGDLDRAIALSDAYYGDASSVVILCQEMKMPILIQDAGAVQDNN